MSAKDSTQFSLGRPRGAGQGSDELQTQLRDPRKKAAAHLSIVEGPGTGERLPIYPGSNALGRDPAANLIVVDFGDPAISRTQHAIITCDAGSGACGLRSNGHPNPVYLNGRVLDGHQAMRPGDRIRIGRTTFELGL